MRYILFVKDDCTYCTKAAALLEKKDLSYNLVSFDTEQESVLKEIKAAYDWKTVPMVFYKNGSLTKFIGGYTELAAELGDG
jgi:glutaredoxin